MMGMWTPWFTKIKGPPSLGKHPKVESNIWESKFQEERNLFPYTEIPVRLLITFSAEISQHRKGLQSEIIQNTERKVKSANQDYCTWQTCPSETKEKNFPGEQKLGKSSLLNLPIKKCWEDSFRWNKGILNISVKTGIQNGKVKVHKLWNS